MTPTKQTNIHYYYYFKPKARHQTKDFPNNTKLVVLTAMGKCPLLTSNTDMHGPQILAPLPRTLYRLRVGEFIINH